ncbi:MAG: phosphomethylpyrimidine kinase [Methanocorpusculum sp.]|nr:phosphomethylpyrimidine kinase [Methanocorpusculum sp.]
MALAYTVKNPRGMKDIAVVRSTGIGFGTDDLLVRMLLTVVRFDADIRAVGCIRYTEEIAGVVRETLRDVAEYDPAKFPPGISSMDWGIASCCRDGVPLVIIDGGTKGAEPLIRILGSTPEEVANRILIISERLTYTDI